MTTADYLVEMTFPPFASLPAPQDVATFTERFVLPTLDACEKWTSAGRILAGGPLLAATGFTFIARAESPAQLEDMIGGLPLWPRAQTRIVPLGTFAQRAATVRQRLERLRAAGAAPAPVPVN